MPGEYNRATWAFKPVALGHTPRHIVAAFKSLLTQSGWVLAPWSQTVDNNYFVRADRAQASLIANANGTAHNVAITKVGTNLTVAGMSGGSTTAKSTGSVLITDHPTDGDTVTIGDGALSKTFEFETGNAFAKGSVVFYANPATANTIAVNDGVTTKTFEFTNGSPSGSNIAVAINGTLTVTVTNFISALNAAGFNVTAVLGLNTLTVLLTNSVVGLAGNQPIVTVTATQAFVAVGMSRGGIAGTVGSNIPVTIGATLLQTVDNLIVAINASGLTVTASVATYRWRYNGDGPEQACGMRVFYDSANSRVSVHTFLQTVDGTTSQVETTVGQRIQIVYDLTVENDFLLFGGEDAMYFECGRDGNPNNLATGAIVTYMPIPLFAGTRDLNVKWGAQGLVMDLFGALKWSNDRNWRFVDNNGANRNYTGSLFPEVSRGSPNMRASAPVNNQRYFIIPRDTALSRIGNGANIGAVDPSSWFGCASFALLDTPFDDHYKISPFWMLQDSANLTPCTVNSSDPGNNNFAANGQCVYLYESRFLRQVLRIAAVDQTVLPFANITDVTTGIVYRISAIPDSGRTTNVAIEYPSAVVTIPASPT